MEKEQEMVVKSSDLKKLEDSYAKSGNQLLVVYGRKDCGKEDMLREFSKGKSCFYYRCRQAGVQDQMRMMGEELSAQLDVEAPGASYDDYFTNLKGKGSGKVVVIIDEVQFLMKKDDEFLKSIIKLRTKHLYQKPVLIVLASSSIIWVEQELKEMLGEEEKRVDEFVKIEELNFLEVVRSFSSLPVAECVKIYGAIGGVQGYISKWNPRSSFKDNISRLVLTKGGMLFNEAQDVISSEIRELTVYNTILSAIARGYNKLNDLYQETGFSRAKISVYLKNLSQFDIVEKVVSFETSGWDNAKKGVYQIKDTFVNFWFKFVFPHQSDLYRMEPGEFYDLHIQPELDEYLNRYFKSVCMEYLMLQNQMGELPFKVHKVGTWVGKTGEIDIVAQSEDRQNLVGFCNWEKPMMTLAMCDEMTELLDKAKIKSDHFYLFSAKAFEPALVKFAEKDKRYKLVDMNEL